MHIIQVNEYYYIKIHDNNEIIRLYQLFNCGDNLVCESYNRDLFILKCNKFVKLNNEIQCLIASY